MRASVTGSNGENCTGYLSGAERPRAAGHCQLRLATLDQYFLNLVAIFGVVIADGLITHVQRPKAFARCACRVRTCADLIQSGYCEISGYSIVLTTR